MFRTYLCKLVYIFREYGLRETLYICYNFLGRHVGVLFLRWYRPKPALLPLIPGLMQGHHKARQKARAALRMSFDKQISIAGGYVCPFGDDADFTDTKTIVIAHWDPQQRVDNYVKCMCCHFRSLGWKVLLASAAPLAPDEDTPHWHTWADAIVCRTCSGYDFTSWKAALHCFPSLFKAKELVLCNDSFFAPVGSFALLHTRMDSMVCDFWGLTESHEICPHIQSYYVVFRQKVLQHAAFLAFFDSAPLSDSRDDAVALELSLTLWLALHGLRAAAVWPLPFFLGSRVNPSIYLWRQLIETGIPILKRERLHLGSEQGSKLGWNSLLREKKYDLDLICRYYWRLNKDISSTICGGKRCGQFPPDVFSLQRTVDVKDTHRRSVSSIPFAVVLHCYYPELLIEIIKYLRHIPRRAHIFVSTDTEEKARAIAKIMLAFQFNTVEIRVFPNRGWDIGPLLVGFRYVLERFSFILKIHVKKSSQLSDELGAEWRELLYASLMPSKKKIEDTLICFEAQKDLGMIAPPTWLGLSQILQGSNHVQMKNVLQKKGMDLPRKAAIDFPAGSMFWCRSRALQPWLKMNLTFEDFEETATSPRDGTLAHAFERLFFWGCGLEALYWARIAPGSQPLSPLPTPSKGED